MSRPASPAAATAAQTAVELRLTARRGENLLVMIVIPVVVLLFFTLVAVLPAQARRGSEWTAAAGNARAGGHRVQLRQPGHRHGLRA